MSETIQHDGGKISLALRRCYECGRWWGIEHFGTAVDSCTCPRCAREEIQKSNAAADVAKRSAAAARGAYQRLKRRGTRSRRSET